MSTNILELVKEQVTGQLSKQASSFLGETENNTKSALNGIFPALIGSVINKVEEEPKGAQGILDLIGGIDNDIVNNIGSIFGGGASSVNSLLTSGSGIIESLLGSKSSGVVELISKISGLKNGSNSALLKMAGPMLMGVIGKQLHSKEPAAIIDLMLGQKSTVSNHLPAGLGSLLGLDFVNKLKLGGDSLESTLTQRKSDEKRNETNTDNKLKSSGSSLRFLKWLIPILFIGGFLWWYFGMKSPNKVISDAAEATKEVTESVVEATKGTAQNMNDATKDMSEGVSTVAKNAFETVDQTAMAALEKIEFAANSAGDQLLAFIDGGFVGEPSVIFNDLTFETGSATITNQSGIEIDNLSAILKAYPDVNIEINGYTDSTGEEKQNVDLSKARAIAVKERLVSQGVSAARISTNGYGSDNPIATNETEEGRAKNRRIEVVVVQ